MLTRTLNTHPQVRCLDEVFINRFPNRNTGSYQEYIRRSISARMKHVLFTEQSVKEYLAQLESKPIHLFLDNDDRTQCRRIGFKLMLSDVRRLPMVLKFARANSIQLIHIIRESSLDILISTVRKNISKMPHLPVEAITNEDYKPPKVTLRIKKLIHDIEKIESSKQTWLEIMQDSPYTTTYYEQIVRNREEELEKIMRVLGVDISVTLETPLRKIGPSKLSQSINNYEEVVRCLRGSAYERYLYD